jgi:hypothetical protein
MRNHRLARVPSQRAAHFYKPREVMLERRTLERELAQLRLHENTPANDVRDVLTGGRRDIAAFLAEARQAANKSLIILGENHSADTRSVNLVLGLLADRRLLYIASEYFLNAGEFRREIQDFLVGRRNQLGGLLCPYEPLFRELRARPRYLLFAGSRRDHGRDLPLASRFIEEHADRKHLRKTSPGVLVLGANHAARRPGSTRTWLEQAGFAVIGARVFTDDLDRRMGERCDRVWPVGARANQVIRLVDALPADVDAVALRTRDTVFASLDDGFPGGSIADRFELVIVARSIPRPCPGGNRHEPTFGTRKLRRNLADP